ncbi:hypothetical protein AGMMS50256_19760 [Betaproteobacteria bacterium]|nr:hypothetical protein AGMMS50256_19760 [Betaproteobacteria bacterium]
MRGFSLVELSVSLAILAVLGFSLWKLIPAFDQVGETNPADAQLALADEAIIGFIMREHRLPCPDTNGNGEENYTLAAGCGSVIGNLPGRALGLRLTTPLRYGVYQDGAAPLTRLTTAQTPWLPPSADDSTTKVWPLSGDTDYDPGTGDYDYEQPEKDMDDVTYPPVPRPDLGQMSTLDKAADVLVRAHPTGNEMTAAANTINGLDFCAKLRALQIAAPAPPITANSIPVAYALAHPGKLDANGDGNVFDGSNATANFEAPHQEATAIYDDQVLAAGFNELSARLSCPAYLSRANAAGHTARAAYDNYRFALAYLQYRAFALDGAYGDLQQAYAGVVLSAINVAGATLAAVMSSAAAVLGADEVAPMVIAGFGIAIAATALAEGIVELVLVIVALPDAIDAVTEAGDARIEAEAHARKIRDVASATAQRALTLDAKGLRP